MLEDVLPAPGMRTRPAASGTNVLCFTNNSIYQHVQSASILGTEVFEAYLNAILRLYMMLQASV